MFCNGIMRGVLKRSTPGAAAVTCLLAVAAASCTTASHLGSEPATSNAGSIASSSTTTSTTTLATAIPGSTAPPTVAMTQVASQVLVTSCGSGGAVKPASIVLACADGNAQAVKLVWSSWGSSEATGSGDYTVNDCVPSCVAGKFHEYPAMFILTKVRTVGGSQYFTTLEVQFTAGSPFNGTSREFPIDTP